MQIRKAVEMLLVVIPALCVYLSLIGENDRQKKMFLKQNITDKDREVVLN